VVDKDMQLPVGMLGKDCAHFKRCSKLFGCKVDSDSCDFAPSRFRAAGTAEAQTKTSTNKPSGEICPQCGGEVLINKPSGNGFCLQCEYTITGKLSRSVG
jgi:hypothetical protein